MQVLPLVFLTGLKRVCRKTPHGSPAVHHQLSDLCVAHAAQQEGASHHTQQVLLQMQQQQMSKADGPSRWEQLDVTIDTFMQSDALLMVVSHHTQQVLLQTMKTTAGRRW
jgi:hypothetical protein